MKCDPRQVQPRLSIAAAPSTIRNTATEDGSGTTGRHARRLTRAVTLRAGVLNLTDAKYFEWPSVRGRQATDPTIDRYTSPGVSGLVSLSYAW